VAVELAGTAAELSEGRRGEPEKKNWRKRKEEDFTDDRNRL
jgi:hypothetical protein